MLDRSESLTSHVTTLSQNWLEYQKKMINLKDQLDKVEGKVIKFIIKYQKHAIKPKLFEYLLYIRFWQYSQNNCLVV